MEPEASRAAIAAIAALHARVRELEKEQMDIISEMDKYKIKINTRDEMVQQRALLLDSAADKAKEMLSYVTECNHDRVVARDRNKKLKKNISKAKKTIASFDPNEEEQKRAHRQTVKTELSNILQKVSDYEILLSEYVKPVPSSCSPEGALRLAVSDGDASLLPQPQRMVLECLQKLPKDFKSQTVEEKKDTIQLLTIAKNYTRELARQIKELELEQINTQEPDRFDSEIKKIAAQHLLISTEMNKFNFEQ